MLENLDTIDWANLTHAYGSARDVPDQIRGLASRDPDTRKRAIYDLYGNIFHQSTRYQATPHAVPFLYELVASTEVPDRHEIAYLLVKLALGFEEAYLPDGVDALALRRRLEESDSKLSPSDRAECATYGYGPRVELDCYDAVRRGVPVLIERLVEDDERLRCAAAYALAWFPEDASQSLPALGRVLVGASDEAEVANALLAIGLLARSSHPTVDPLPFHGFLSHASLIVRTAAAIAVARDPLADDLVKILVNAIQSAEQLEDRGRDLRFNEGGLTGYASIVLARSGVRAREKIVPALCGALQAVDSYRSVDVTHALLQIITGDKTQSIKDLPPSSLDALELTALRAIADHGGWTLGRCVFANYGELLRAYGVPHSEKALKEYLRRRAR